MTAAANMQKPNSTHIGVRCPRDLYEVLAQEAERERRPISVQLLWLAEQQLRERYPHLGDPSPIDQAKGGAQ